MFSIRKGDGETVYLSGIFDGYCADEALQVFQTVSSSCSIDCRKLEYISSAGLGMIMALYKRIAAQGGTIQLINVRENVKTIFLLVHFDKFFKISSLEETPPVLP